MIRRATAPRTIEVRKTDAQEYIRCHADPEWRMDCVVLHIKRRETTYLVRPELYASLRHEVKFQALITCVTTDGVVFLLPLNCRGPSRRLDSWTASRWKLVELAEKYWIRMVADQDRKEYMPILAEEPYAEPPWPAAGPKEVFRLGFEGRTIEDLNRPEVLRLKGHLEEKWRPR